MFLWFGRSNDTCPESSAQGIAAKNIGGITVMKAFRQRPFQTAEPYGSNAKATAELDEMIPKIGLIIKDEISMISQKQLTTVERICSESINEYHRSHNWDRIDNTPWGGLNIILGNEAVEKFNNSLIMQLSTISRPQLFKAVYE